MHNTRIDMDNVSFKYGRSFILKNMNLNLSEKTKTGLHAPNGAGKSTFIALLAKMILPTNGRIATLEQNKPLPKSDFYQRLGVVLSHPYFVFDFSLEENFYILGKLYPKHSPDMLESLKHQFKLDTQWSLPFKHLSAGQKKKASLIRALFHEPSFLLLDEPTLGLDQSAKETLNNILQRQTILTVIASHDEDFLNQSTQTRITIEKQHIQFY